MEGAIAAIDRVAEAGANAYEAGRKVKDAFGAVARSGGPLTATPAPPEVEAFADLMAEAQGIPTMTGEQEIAAARATVERIQREIPEVVKEFDDPTARRDAAELGRALSRSTLAQISLLELHLNGHRAVDAARRQRSRLAIATAGVPTGSTVLEAADRVVADLHAYREAVDAAMFGNQDPRSQESVITARAACGPDSDAFCADVAEAVEGRSSRRWRWRL